MKCRYCIKEFETYSGMRKHMLKHHVNEMENEVFVCKFCGLKFDNYNKLGGHSRVCKENPNANKNKQKTRENHTKTFHWNEEQKLKISEQRKQFLKNNPDKHPWKKNDKFKSIPCEKFKEYLMFEGFTFVEEYTDTNWKHYYSLDIAFVDKKIAIEINGNQHYNKDGSLKTYYQDRHNYLETLGWSIFEIPYIKVYDIAFVNSFIEELKCSFG